MMTKSVLSGSMYAVLEFLARRAPQRTVRVSEISREVHLPPSVVSSNLKKLSNLGLVEGGGWDGYKVTLRGKILVDIFVKKDLSDEELIRYWMRAVIQPRLADMMSIARTLQEHKAH